MENQEHFGRLTDRMAAFREEVLEEKPYIDAERAVLATQAYKENQNQPRVMVQMCIRDRQYTDQSKMAEESNSFCTFFFYTIITIFTDITVFCEECVKFFCNFIIYVFHIRTFCY